MSCSFLRRRADSAAAVQADCSSHQSRECFQKLGPRRQSDDHRQVRQPVEQIRHQVDRFGLAWSMSSSKIKAARVAHPRQNRFDRRIHPRLVAHAGRLRIVGWADPSGNGTPVVGSPSTCATSVARTAGSKAHTAAKLVPSSANRFAFCRSQRRRISFDEHRQRCCAPSPGTVACNTRIGRHRKIRRGRRLSQRSDGVVWLLPCPGGQKAVQAV